ncbi:TIGR00300 family protein [archaeon SCG-AAA382B04]|nr:TIGR00300 family protein [archaeon SCG-AAA382B04]
MPIREIELEGHIIDSGVLPKVFNTILDKGGDFEVLEFDIGKRKKDKSYARLRVEGDDETHLDKIISQIHRQGARLPEIEEVDLKEAKSDQTPPRNFYTTTNHKTWIRYNDIWKKVKKIEMDCAIVLEDGEAYCKPINEIKKGNKVVVGENGIRVVPPERPREKSVFEFMGSHVSPEKPSETIIQQLAEKMKEIKEKGGKIGFVLGPAVIHTGCAEEVAELVKNGFIDVLLGGNAIAAHDIERAMYGTSLGINLEKVEPETKGHRNHLYAISEVMRSGSIKEAIEDGKIKEGIMYECIQNDVEYVLAGSIRDDGPLPKVITDTQKAQHKMRKAVRGVDLMIMMATTLHSIATGNILPSYVKTVCVDISQSTVTELTDRGSAQAMGIVTDVGTFIPMLNDKLFN